MELYIFFSALTLIFVSKANSLIFTKLFGKDEVDPSLIVTELRDTGSSICCAELCSRTDLCWSFSYGKVTSKCRLISVALNETVVQGIDQGWDYFVASDPCSPTWINFGNSCYKVETHRRTFYKAMNDCSDLEGHLISIEDGQEQFFVQSLISHTGEDLCWIGLSDVDLEGKWLWYPSLSEANFTFWDTNEPNSGTAENCVAIHTVSMKWHDVSCSYQLPFICEREIII